ncbi:hypothetical protein HMPREF1218_0783 [Hoylesella pleuritidis F0068]|uniref:Uncharacterized protein n=1 Tax=Hoylesella pleuritidis F0068 TaxID=1081904 RepID=U2KZY3_9BACT|nr:hypothetical protein HMPREF1218_0783 [Hoylesella pleuritidis F0068]
MQIIGYQINIFGRSNLWLMDVHLSIKRRAINGFLPRI